jgi:hypothetical protein
VVTVSRYGRNESALLGTLRERGVKVTAPGEHAALIVLARTLAVELDAGDPSATMAQAYLSALRLLLDATKVEEVDDDGAADTLAELRAL